MMLYVWEQVLESYRYGIMFAWADSVEQAREKIIEKAAVDGGRDVGDALAEWRLLLDDEEAMSAFLDRSFENENFGHRYWTLYWVADRIIPDFMKEPRTIDGPEGWLIFGSD